MPEPALALALALEGAAVPRTPRRRWIDVVLVAAGVVCLTRGWPWPAAALIGFGGVMPLVERSGRRRAGADLVHLVPAELAAAHDDLVAVAALPGVNAPEVLDAAEESLLEVVALLGGREPRGAAQRRFVAVRCSVMRAAAAEQREWSEAWVAARAEVALVALVDPATAPSRPEPATGWLAGALAVALSPVFIAWDSVGLLARGAVVLVDGLALRARAVARLVGGARRAWRRARVQVTHAAAQARHRFLAVRGRLHLRLRRARRRAFGPGRATAAGRCPPGRRSAPPSPR